MWTDNTYINTLLTMLPFQLIHHLFPRLYSHGKATTCATIYTALLCTLFFIIMDSFGCHDLKSYTVGNLTRGGSEVITATDKFTDVTNPIKQCGGKFPTDYSIVLIVHVWG